MKRPLFKGLFFCLSTLCFKHSLSQNTYAVFGGLQFTSATYKVNDSKQPASFKKGLQLGATMKVPFENNLYFSPSVYYSQKGYKVTLNQASYPPTEFARNNKTVLHTIEMAPMLQYDFTNQPSHFFVKLGPAIDFVLSGTEEFDLVDGERIKRAMPFSFDAYGRITAQAILHFGYQSAKGYMLFAHYGEGLGSLNNADDGPIIKHRIVGVSVGWFLPKNRTYTRAKP